MRPASSTDGVVIYILTVPGDGEGDWYLGGMPSGSCSKRKLGRVVLYTIQARSVVRGCRHLLEGWMNFTSQTAACMIALH